MAAEVLTRIQTTAEGPDRTQERPETATLTELELQEPSLYEVVLHNDDYTTMEFVVSVLMEVFRKTPDQATSIMLSVHHKGAGVAGVYCLEIAETKVEAVRERARAAEFPLRCTLREVAP